ncbi:MAG: hypothetical protein FWG50_09965 [Kiritimatiellaeota bacterium]|nr:hypothetical protein [Kiritimatiellota bacterium]
MSGWVSGIAVAVVLGALGVGCSSSADIQRKAAEQKRTWLLEADTSAVAARAARFDEIKMRAFRGLPPFNTASLVVKRANGETVLDFYNAWVAAPHEMARVQAARYLEKTGLFRAVHDGASGALPPLGLEGTLCELFLDCRGARPEAVVTLRLVVLDERAPSFTVVCSAERTARAVYDAAREDGIADAFTAALTLALDALAQELREKEK